MRHLFAALLILQIWSLDLKSAERAPSVAEQAIRALTEQMHGTLVKAAGLGEMSEPPKANDTGMMRALNQVLSQLIADKGDRYQTFRVMGNQKKSIEISGLSLNGPYPRVVTEADKLNGIEQRVGFTFSAKGHRSFESAGGWSKWVPGKPILMSGIELERTNGRWVVSAAPTNFYASR